MTEDFSGHRKRLRERFQKNGLKGFADHEILELLLTLCIPRKDVKALAKTLLKKFGSIRNVFDADHFALLSVKGIGENTSTCLGLIKAFSDYYLQQKTEDIPVFNNNEALVKFWQSRLGGLKHEVLEIAYLDNAYRIMNDGIERLEEGTVNKTPIYPRKILTSALKHEASHIVIAHNHPSSNPAPSQADFQLTQTLQHACVILSIRLLDHIIVTKDKFYSFRQSGFLE